MRTTDVELILQTYDEAINKRKAILSLSKLLSADPDEIIEKLQQNGREIALDQPKKKPTKGTETKAEELKKVITENPLQSVEPQAAGLPMPEYVRDILFEKFSDLERELGELQEKLKKTEDHYNVLRGYLFN